MTDRTGVCPGRCEETAMYDASVARGLGSLWASGLFPSLRKKGL
jgi:hypothetical protein